MPHLIPSHKSEELLSNKLLAIEAPRIATRTSSVRVKPRGRSPRSYIQQPEANAEHHYISSREALASAGRDSDMGRPCRTQSRARKLAALFDDFVVHMHQHQKKSKIPSSRVKSSSDKDTKRDNVAHTSESAHLSDNAERFPRTLPAAQPGQQLQKRMESKESILTDAEDEVWYECDQNALRGKEEEHTAQQEYRVRIWWETIRLALQVDLESSSKCSPASSTQLCPRVWKHSGSNFFPPWFSHLEQDEIVEAVLEEGRLSQQSKGA